MSKRLTDQTVSCCPVVELRQYTLHPGQRDTLIELFDREFVETQEAVGMHVIGQFRDLDNPDRFVWLRGFRDMPSRAQALGTFYGGPVWAKHRMAANATMIDSDNVLLLRPGRAGSGFTLDAARPAATTAAAPQCLVVATIWYFDAPLKADVVELFETMAKPELAATGAPVLASFVTEYSTNTFPQLPVREGEHVLVWFGSFREASEHQEHLRALAVSERWQDAIWPVMSRRLSRAPEILRLQPTTRSLLRG